MQEAITLVAVAVCTPGDLMSWQLSKRRWAERTFKVRISWHVGSIGYILGLVQRRITVQHLLKTGKASIVVCGADTGQTKQGSE